MRTLDLKWTHNLSSFKLKKRLMENSKVSFYDIQIEITVAYNGGKINKRLVKKFPKKSIVQTMYQHNLMR